MFFMRRLKYGFNSDANFREKKQNPVYCHHTKIFRAFEAVSETTPLEQRQGLQVGSPDEIAFAKGWISRNDLAEQAELFAKNEYGNYLSELYNFAAPQPALQAHWQKLYPAAVDNLII